MTPDLTLTGEIDGLLRRGSPIRVSLASDAVIQGVYLFGRAVCQDGGLMDWYDIGESSEDVAPAEVALDLTDPLGVETALLYLAAKGHDLRWAAAWPDVVAWSVLSVSRGGGVIAGVDRFPSLPLAKVLAAGYALTNPDGALTLPELPKGSTP